MGRAKLLKPALLVLVLAAASLVALNWGAIRDYQQSRDYRKHEKAVMEAEEIEAQHCVAELARRNPVADAERDFARGDETPIGLTYTPHDPPEPSTMYEGACEYEYAGKYRQTGKWFTYSRDGYSLLGDPPSHGTCRRAARDYATRYNRRMAQLAPVAVRNFCLGQQLSTSARLGAASIAVLGTWQKREVIDGKNYRTEGSWVVDAPFGPVLLTKSNPPNAGPYCSACEVGVGIAYLDEEGALITVRRRWPLVWTRESDRNREGVYVGGFSLNDQLTSYPALGVNHRQSPANPRCVSETLIELRPEGPVNRGTIYQRVGDRFENIKRGLSFEMVAANSRDRYEMKGGRFVGPTEPHLKC